MSQRTLPELPPVPAAYSDLNAWAAAMSAFLRRDALTGTAKQTEPVRLMHLDTSTAKTFQDGVVVYDPVLNKLAMTVSGAWKTYSPDP